MSGTNQENFWIGKFGQEYTNRNTPKSFAEWEQWYVNNWGKTRLEMNAEFIDSLPRDINLLEIGCNSGNQLLALKEAGFTNIYGIDLQAEAIELAKDRTGLTQLSCASGFNIPFEDGFFDLVVTNGTLIHIAPGDHARIMSEMFRVSKRYIWGFEYYAEDIESISYRGEEGYLWKADFARIFLEQFPSLVVVKKKLYPYVRKDMEGLFDAMYLLEKSK